jgi:adenosyl cobinamide kinase/adenosyl cobinamide phosphate guanylyltransferase
VITLVLGGTRSGKSEVAEALAAAAPPPVTYVATGTATDDEMAARIAAHRARRPASWATAEAGAELPAVLAGVAGTALVDSLGTWVAAVPDLAPDAAALVRALRDRRGDTIVVSEEVGLGVHPATAAGRRFADELGLLNRAVADVADRVLLVVAGRVLPLDRFDPGALGPPPPAVPDPGADAAGPGSAPGVAGAHADRRPPPASPGAGLDTATAGAGGAGGAAPGGDRPGADPGGPGLQGSPGGDAPGIGHPSGRA